MVRSFFFSSRRRHTRLQGDWSSDVCSSDLRFLPECPLSEKAVTVAITLPYAVPAVIAHQPVSAKTARRSRRRSEERRVGKECRSRREAEDVRDEKRRDMREKVKDADRRGHD